MKTLILLIISLLTAIAGYGQQPDDTWKIVTPASDDRYTNPKSKLYNGPNGWFNFGEVRAQVSNTAKTSYNFQGGFRLINHAFNAFASGKNHIMYLDFGTDRPAAGVYQVTSKADAAQKKAHLSFADVSNSQILEWSGSDNSGTITVSLVNGFMYVKCRNVRLQPTGLSNKDDLKQPMTLGFEGAIAPD